jgi:cyclophilin family peptidyl-prolyl cis-trans isomerase
MAKHKDPTQVTIASIQERTFLHEFVERYWLFGLGLAAVATAAILIPHFLRQRSQGTAAADWDRLRAEIEFGSPLFGGIQGGSVAALASFAKEKEGLPVGAWAKTLEIGSRIKEEQYEEAERAAMELASAWPEHQILLPTTDGQVLPLGDVIRTKRAALEAWKKEHAFLFSNPALPADAPRVRLNTTKGPIVVGLYVDRAPKHAERFLDLCRDGFYNGTKFHRVVRGTLIQGGDPNSISGEPDTWGKGGPEGQIDPEIDPALRCFRGSLVAWAASPGAASHGSQFFLTTADQHEMDGEYSVFGRVIEGDSVIETIETGAVVGEVPQAPVSIESVEIL